MKFRIALIVASLAILSCSKDKETLPIKPNADLSFFNGRWAQFQDTSNHWYFDSLETLNPVVRYPTGQYLSLNTYSLNYYLFERFNDTLKLFIENQAKPNFIIDTKTGRGFQVLFNYQTRDTEFINIIQIDTNNNQPKPSTVSPL